MLVVDLGRRLVNRCERWTQAARGASWAGQHVHTHTLALPVCGTSARAAPYNVSKGKKRDGVGEALTRKVFRRNVSHVIRASGVPGETSSV